MKTISFVFSFKNEEKNLEELIKRIHESVNKLKNYKYELIFVNDASTDNSEKTLEKLQKSFPITLINMSRTFGVGPCVLAGFKHASGDCIVYMDSDLQDPPEILKQLIGEYENGADVVHTIRTDRLGESKFKLLITKVAYKIINFLSDIKLPVEAGDFKLISRKALTKILEQKEFRPYIRGLSVWVGFKQAHVNYVRDARFSGDTKFPLLSAGPVTQFISGVTAYSLKPLYFGILLGIISILFSIILIFYALYMKFTNIAVPGTAGIIITISFFAGIILLTLGIIGIYLARIFEEVRGRDSYVIKDIKKL
jgi:polyisoprenyl-phosphate glycosyltransferase|tara:strand:+ start:1614 stop:2543 length:930 start_codon:yes stop_codon:yes gene_type:complete